MGLPEEGGASRVISPQPSTLTGTRDSHGGCVNRAHTRPPDLARFHQPLCCLMASESFGCQDISRHRWGASAGWGELLLHSAGERLTRSVWWLTASSGCTARGVGCYWTRVGCTLGRWGLRAVRTTLGQWIPTLVEQANSRRDSGRSRRRVIASRPQHRRRSEVGGGGPETETPGTAARPTDSRSCAAWCPQC